MNLLPTLTFQIKARAGDWAVGGKVKLKRFWERRKREEERGSTEEEVGGKRSSSMWPGGTTSYKGSHRWGRW